MGTNKAALERYPALIAQLTLGKRLPEAVYLHADAVLELDAELRALVALATELAADAQWNVVKLNAAEPRISLLHYPDFIEDAFPVLHASTVVDLKTGSATHRQYDQANPPILHRKELLLPKKHPLFPLASALTARAEELGLFEDPSLIGHRQAWDARLAKLRLRVVQHELVVASVAEEIVQRHKTALTRYSLSTPAQALWRHGFLDGTRTLFDYGCGRGDDLRTLQSLGVDATGWDPHYVPDGVKRKSDIVNLGFVLNVIEDPDERMQALQQAWQLAEQLLVVSVMIRGRSTFERFRLYSDGVITARSTFQRYFTTTEFREYIEAQLGREPIMLAPGTAFVFRNDLEEQTFFARRSSRRVPQRAAVPGPRAERPFQEKSEATRQPAAKQPRLNRWAANSGLVESFWRRCIDLGRPPEPDEFEGTAAIKEALGLPATVFKSLVKRRGDEELAATRTARIDDVLVFLALNLFERRKSFGSLPEQVRRDVKAFFKSFQAAQAEAQALLFSAGRSDAILAACRLAASRGTGLLDSDHSLQVHASLASELPALLRIYLGCAARLYGDVETADMVKLHVQSGKVSLMIYDDFDERPLPDLIERVKINLRRQQIDFFEYGTAETPAQPLYLKSRFMRPGFANYEDQLQFDEQLTKLDLDLSGFGPSHEALSAALTKAACRVVDFRIVPETQAGR